MTEDNNWFQKNPKKTISVFVLAMLLLMIFSAEKYLDLKNRNYLTNHEQNRILRYIRLREHPPLFDGIVKPDDAYMRETDSLLQIERKFRTDKDGFIMPSSKHNDPDVNIFFLGGSTTECMEVDEQNRFPYLAGDLLEKKSGMKINSFNSGVSGNNSLHSLNIFLNKIVPMNPDIVVMMHNINDLNILLVAKSYWNTIGSKSSIQVIEEKGPEYYTLLKTLKNMFIPNIYKYIEYNFFTGKLHEDEFIEFRGKTIAVDEAMIIREYKKNLQTFIDLCKVREITPVLMTMASRFSQGSDKPVDSYFDRIEKDYRVARDDYKKIFDMFNQTIIEMGRLNNVLVIDLAKEIPQTKEYMYDIVHFNDKGSRLASEIISNSLMTFIHKAGN